LANIVSEDDLKVGRLYPPLSEIKNVSLKIAVKIVEDAYKNGMVQNNISGVFDLIILFLIINKLAFDNHSMQNAY
jgi:hypothetical protein